MRLIPLLQIHDNELTKTVRFKQRHYVGDPVNAVRIFNLKTVDEIALIDIDATLTQRPNFNLLGKIASQAFMPLSYGGGVATMNSVDRLFEIGFDKIIAGTALHRDPDFIQRVVAKYGSQAVVAAIDGKRRGRLEKSWQVTVRGGRDWIADETPWTMARRAEELGVGEILLQDIDRDGTELGLDHGLVKAVSAEVSIPVIAAGGAASWDDMCDAVHRSGAAAAASGTRFTFYGRYHAVLQNYPEKSPMSDVDTRSLREFVFD